MKLEGKQRVLMPLRVPCSRVCEEHPGTGRCRWTVAPERRTPALPSCSPRTPAALLRGAPIPAGRRREDPRECAVPRVLFSVRPGKPLGFSGSFFFIFFFF